MRTHTYTFPPWNHLLLSLHSHRRKQGHRSSDPSMQLWQNQDKTHLPIPRDILFWFINFLPSPPSEHQQLLPATTFPRNKLKWNGFRTPKSEEDDRVQKRESWLSWVIKVSLPVCLSFLPYPPHIRPVCVHFKRQKKCCHPQPMWAPRLGSVCMYAQNMAGSLSCRKWSEKLRYFFGRYL